MHASDAESKLTFCCSIIFNLFQEEITEEIVEEVETEEGEHPVLFEEEEEEVEEDEEEVRSWRR